jgi:hypothetical protein
MTYDDPALRHITIQHYAICEPPNDSEPHPLRWVRFRVRWHRNVKAVRAVIAALTKG